MAEGDRIPNFETSTPTQNGKQPSPSGTATGIRCPSGDERQTVEEKIKCLLGIVARSMFSGTPGGVR